MTTTMYLNNQTEIAAAVRAIKSLGYITTQREIRAGDRYVMNIVERFAGADRSAQRRLEEAIVGTVAAERQ